MALFSITDREAVLARAVELLEADPKLAERLAEPLLLLVSADPAR